MSVEPACKIRSTVGSFIGRARRDGGAGVARRRRHARGAPCRRSRAAKKGGREEEGDLAILGAAQIAEALAVTTYTNIIQRGARSFGRLESDDQGLPPSGSRGGDVRHYLLEAGCDAQAFAVSPRSTTRPEDVFSDGPDDAERAPSRSRTRFIAA